MCHSSEKKLVLSCKDFPYVTVPLTKEDQSNLDKKYSKDKLHMNLEYAACMKCGHCIQTQLPDFTILNDLYADYYQYPSPLEANFEPTRDNQFSAIALEYLLKNIPPSEGGDILEVACFDGYVLKKLQKEGYTVTGCDPSEGALIGQKHGVNIYREFFNPNKFKSRGELFDVIISRHFLEHVTDPQAYVSNFKKILRPNGVLIIEVPNVSYYLSNGIMEVFSPQHIQGFTGASLTRLLNADADSQVTVKKSENNLIAIAKLCDKGSNKESSISYESIYTRDQKTIEMNKAKIKTIIFEYVKKGKKISFWGAGGFAMAAIYLYGIEANNISHIIDSDPKKSGMSYQSMPIKIEEPSSELLKTIDLVIVTTMYSNTVVSAIQNANQSIDIMTIYPEVRLLT